MTLSPSSWKKKSTKPAAFHFKKTRRRGASAPRTRGLSARREAGVLNPNPESSEERLVNSRKVPCKRMSALFLSLFLNHP